MDVRVIAASNVELDRAVAERRFREDLFYRLNVVPLHIPALRERREDIPLLLECFLEKTRTNESGAPKKVSDEALDLLMRRDWPGNVRQLEHTVQMAFVLSGDRYLLGPQDFIFGARPQSDRHPIANPESPSIKVGPEGLDFDLAVGKFERSLLNQALTLSRGNKARAADLLRIKRTTLLAKMKAFDERETADCVVR